MVAAMAVKSALSYCQASLMACQSSRLLTATMIVAARVALGRKYRAGVRKAAARAMPPAVIIDAAWVLAPASKLTTDREKPPVTGNPPETPAAILAAPSPISSWFGSMRSPRLPPRVRPTETDSTNPMRAINRAGTSNSPSTASERLGAEKAGNPWGMAPTSATPLVSRLPRAASKIVNTTAITGAVLVISSAVERAIPRVLNAPASRVRQSCKNSRANAPMASV